MKGIMCYYTFSLETYNEPVVSYYRYISIYIVEYCVKGISIKSNLTFLG